MELGKNGSLTKVLCQFQGLHTLSGASAAFIRSRFLDCRFLCVKSTFVDCVDFGEG